MRKIALTVLIFGMTFGVAGAASVNGDFEGNPVVKVQSAGQELKVEDVPATIYNGRTVVPVYLLRQLGANVDWNAEKYSVNITLPDSGKSQQPQPDAAQLEQQLLKNTYLWLQDTDQALSLFTQEMQQIAALPANAANSSILEKEFKKLEAVFNESQQLALKVQGKVQAFESVRSIITTQQKAFDQITQAKNILYLKQTLNTTDLNNNLPTALLNATIAAQETQLNTTEHMHKLLAKEMNLN